MSRRLQALPLLAALAALAVAGCSGDDDSDKDKASTAAETAPVGKPKARTKSGEPAKKSAGAKRSAGKKGKTVKGTVSEAELQKEREAIRKEEAEDRKQDREFDREFSETALERIVSDLPIRKPPLFVEQYITSKGSSTVYTAVGPKRFFCGMSVARRKAAVTEFYRTADKRFRSKGVRDFVQVVTPVAETTERLPALAIGRKGSVRLTARGRAKGPC